MSDPKVQLTSEQESRQVAEQAREAEWAGQPAPTVKVSPHSTFGRGM